MNAAGLAPILLVVAVGFEVYCLFDLYRVAEVRYLPKRAWAIICLILIPLGGIVYLSVGRIAPRRARPDQTPPVVTQPGGLPPPRGHTDIAAVIEVDQLTKRFDTVTALDGLSFAVRPGHVTGFLGPNGAGKSTTMRVILGLDAPTSGRALVGGRRYNQIVRPIHHVGSLLDANALHPGRNAWSHLLSVAQCNGIDKRRVREVLELTGIDAVAHRPVKGYSLGMKQRLGIAIALLGDPPVLILDEPGNGLDPEGIQWIRQLLKALAAEGRTILVSSHLMSEMAQTADHLIIIGRGRLLADCTTDRFIASNARSDVLVGSPQAGLLAELLAAHGATSTTESDQRLAVVGLDAPAIADLAAEHAIAVHELTPRHASLEQAYLDLTETSVEYRAGPPHDKEAVRS
jgi:ABC-2 type transport system ATP-binding protein